MERHYPSVTAESAVWVEGSVVRRARRIGRPLPNPHPNPTTIHHRVDAVC
jgi:hypothetical protein